MNSSPLFLLITIFFLCRTIHLSASQKSNLIQYLPEDSFFALEVDDWPSLRENLAKGPWGVVSKFPAWDKISQWIVENWEGQVTHFSEEGRRYAKDHYKEIYLPIIKSMNGGMILAAGKIARSFQSEVLLSEDKKVEQSGWKARRLPNISFLAESSLSDEEFEEMLDWMSAWIKNDKMDHTMIEKSLISGVEVHWIGNAKSEELSKILAKDTMVAVAFHKGMFLAMTGGEEHVKETILRIQGKSTSSSFADSMQYRDCFDEIKKGQARAFLNFEKIFSMAERMEEVQGFKIPENPFQITLKGLIDGLGFYGLDHFAMQIDAADEGFFVSSGLFMNEREGMLALLNPTDAEVEFFDFTPKDAFGVSTIRYDFAEIWPIIEKTLTRISPGLGLLVNSQIQAFEDQAKLPLRKDLFGSMGDAMLSLTYLNQSTSGEIDVEGHSTSIYAISLKDPDLFDRTLRFLFDAVTQGSDLFKEREYRGVLVRSMRGSEGLGSSMSYALFDQWLLLTNGEERHLNQLINRMQGEKSALWEQPYVREVVDDLPSGVRQVDYFKLSQIVPFLSYMFKSVESDMKIDLNPQDFGEFPYFMLGWTMDHVDGMITKVGLFHIPE